ncbi:DUF362 domain-containing protein, partial [Candidatus Pacearchaeota archaeon]|nr:DUF362 domain-containing protein [Candidatus Pacearchaeota archaeon]
MKKNKSKVKKHNVMGNDDKKCDKKRYFWHKIKNNYFILSLIFFFWLIFRTGNKPSRILYPCQKAAAYNSLSLLAMTPFLIMSNLKNFFKNKNNKIKIIKNLSIIIFLVGIITLIISISYNPITNIKRNIEYQKLKSELFSSKLTGFSLLEPNPTQQSVPNSQRVVMIHDSDASNWTGSGYYWTSINQENVDQMVNRGIMELTETNSVVEAWNILIPNYQPHQKIAIKVNMNNAYESPTGWGASRSTTETIDAIIEPINSVAKSLKQAFGDDFDYQDLWVYESTRTMWMDFFNRAELGIQFYSAVPTLNYPVPNTVNIIDHSTQSDAIITFRHNPSIQTGLNNALVNADYLINMPIVKKHGSQTTTLGFKNHFGSIEQEDIPLLHDNILDFINTANNSRIDIYNNTHIKDKTILIIGEGIIGHKDINSGRPVLWDNRFPGTTPEILFFGVDPVATDSVMIDLIEWEKGERETRNARIYLLEASSIGLGVFEESNWIGNNYPDLTTNYSQIEFIHVNLDGTCGDGTCSSGEECNQDCITEIFCSDLADNDEDGLEDCNDNDCTDDSNCDSIPSWDVDESGNIDISDLVRVGQSFGRNDCGTINNWCNRT